MKIFTLGAFGFIGNHLCAKLHQLGHEVITDMRYWSDRYDVIINLAAVTHIRNEFDPKMIESNIILVNEVFKRPERIIQASSCSAAHLTNPYAATKLWAEHLVHKHGNAIGLRFHNVYGSGGSRGIVWFLMNQSDGEKITIRGKDLIRDYIHVDDVVNEIIKNISGKVIKKECRPGFGCRNISIRNTGVKDVGTGVGTTTEKLVELYMKLSGKKFIIDFEEAGTNEPASMISNNIVPHTDLETGLKNVLNGQRNYFKDLLDY